MSLNFIEIEKVLKDFPQAGRVKKIFQNDKSSIIINIFDGKKDILLIVCIKDGYNFLCIIPENEKVEKKDLRFSQFLNANISGYRIKTINQYESSRIVVLELLSPGKEEKKIIFRLWGNGGNILLLDSEDNVIECMRRFPNRSEWPEEKFIFPEKKTSNKVFKVREEFSGNKTNDLVYDFYNQIFQNDDFIKTKKNLQNILKKEINEANERLKKSEKDSSSEREETFLKNGELIKANAYQIKKGMEKIELEDFENNKVTIPLNKELSPIDNAKRYFEKYKKIRDGKINLEKERIKVKGRLENLTYFENLLSEINDMNKLNDLQEELKKIIHSRNIDNNPENRSSVKRFILDGGYTAYVSKSAKDSQEMLKNYAKGNDWWFHIRDYPGSHVVVKKVKLDDITDKAKLEASTLALYFSKKRNAADADIYFTQVKYLHKSKGGPAGTVFPTQEKNIKLKFDKDMLERIFSRS